MLSINRFSSRRHKLDEVFLNEKLRNAKSYKRIAGYFRSSIFELVGESIENIPEVKIVCNSELDTADIAVAKYAREVALKEKWNQVSPEVEALLYRERYKKLFTLLTRGNIEIRVVPKDKIFIHGKAGVIELQDGSKTCFLGSINESKSAFANNYEILWEDPSPEGVSWVEEEFDALWEEGFPLPESIIEEIERISHRIEVKLQNIADMKLPASALAEAPIYRSGEQLQPWQRSFVTTFLEHRDVYGKARLLLADEVGLGKTLSLGTAGLVSALLDDGPVLILCPATLTIQWQTELLDKLGIPSAVWLTNKKVWLDSYGHEIKTRGAEDIVNCPMQIAIVSTGLIFHDSEEKKHLLSRKYGTIILDEAHRARRRGGLGAREKEPNNLLHFMYEIAPRTRHLLLGTATPIQTEVYELWDLLAILNKGAEFVLGKTPFSIWSKCEDALPIIKGEHIPQEEKKAWELLKNPLPPAREHSVFSRIRSLLQIADDKFFSDKGFSSLDYPIRQVISETLDHNFFKQNNPIVRHTVFRRRKTIEEAGMLDRIAVTIHPTSEALPGTYTGVHFVDGLGLMTNHPFNLAYEAAELFSQSLRKRKKSAGFMKTLFLQRICSSFAAGRLTAQRMLNREAFEDEENTEKIISEVENLTYEEKNYLVNIIKELSRTEARDPKLDAVKYFLTEYKTDGKT
ncbi:MAG: phospholipase D-like domain-containing protein, partial [Clostridia bacterium]|nr:phospholipase D-like domain-containing protein [Clostridia bacterium]